MEKNRSSLIDAIEELAPQERQAVCWLMQHYDEAVQICRAKPLSPAESLAWEEKAKAKGDAWTMVLVLLERAVRAQAHRE